MTKDYIIVDDAALQKCKGRLKYAHYLHKKGYIDERILDYAINIAHAKLFKSGVLK